MPIYLVSYGDVIRTKIDEENTVEGMVSKINNSRLYGSLKYLVTITNIRNTLSFTLLKEPDEEVEILIRRGDLW